MHRAIVIDDERHMLQGWETMVDWKGSGYELTAALDDPEDALAWIEAEQPDLVITDIRMPGMSGHDLIRAMRERLQVSSRIVIMTGYAEFQYVRQAMPYKIDRYLLKPIIPDEIHAMLGELSRRMVDRLTRADDAIDEDNAVAGVIRYLRLHYHKKIRIEDLADLCGYHPAYLGKLFKERAGLSILDYLHRLRMQEAQKLLLRTDLQISAIAAMLGYRDSEYFASKFKQHTDMTPSSFKNMKLR